MIMGKIATQQKQYSDKVQLLRVSQNDEVQKKKIIKFSFCYTAIL